jgi:L-malate glycosyltransferase
VRLLPYQLRPSCHRGDDPVANHCSSIKFEGCTFERAVLRRNVTILRCCMNLLHVIPNLGPGGPTRSLTTFVEWSTRNMTNVSHHILTLEPRVYPFLALRLRRCGAAILQNLDAVQTGEMLSHADVVLVHFWNTPLMWQLFAQQTLSVRSVIWATVRGDRLPQRLNANLLNSATGLALTVSAPPCLLPHFEHPPIVPGLIQPDRVAGLVRRPHSGFRIDYIGTTNSGKLDMSVFSIISNLTIPDVKLRIFGGALEPVMEQAHAAMPDPSRVEICGFTENITEVFGTTDVFAYPMAESSYGSSDIALQEAMLAGLAVVIYAHRGPSHFVENEKTGLVVSSPAEFTTAIERLYLDPDLRRELGAAARTYAEVEFGSHKHVARLAGVVEAAAAGQKRPLFAQCETSIELSRLAPAALFLVSQGWPQDEAADAVAAWTEGADDKLSEFAETANDVCYKVEGGIVHWRNHRPGDPLLRAWSGYWLRRLGRDAEAKREFDAALRLGAHAGAVARLAVPR